MRKTAVAVLGLVLAAPAFFLACKRERKTTIAVIPKGNTTIFWQSVHAGAAKAALENGVEIIWNGPPSETDYTGQLQITDAMINRHVNAIVLAPIDRKAMVGMVERAARENVPVVIVDSGIDTERYVARVATDNYMTGRIAADRVGKLVNGKGTVAIVAVVPGGASTEERERGFEDTIHGKYPNIRIVDKRFGMADVARALLVSENILTAHPELDALFGSNESSVMGAAQALRERHGRKIKLVGVDAGSSLRPGRFAGCAKPVQDGIRSAPGRDQETEGPAGGEDQRSRAETDRLAEPARARDSGVFVSGHQEIPLK